MGHNEQVTATDAPAPITDRPLGVVDLLDGAFHALRQRPQTLVLAVAWIAIPGSLLQLVLDTQVFGTSPPTFGNGLGFGGSGGGVTSDSVIFRMLIGWFVTAVSGVAVARIVGGWLIGIDTRPLATIRYTIRRLPVIAIVFVLAHLLTAVGLAMCVIPGLFSIAFFSIASPVIAMEEGIRPFAVLRRSTRLARSNFSAVFGLMVAIFLTGLAIQGGLLVIAAVFSSLPERGSLVLSTAFSLITQLVILPINGAAMALLYLDARFRNEAFDLELRSRRAFADG